MKKQYLKSTGRKGIIAGIALIACSIVGYTMGELEIQTSMSLALPEAVEMFLEGLGILGIRLAVK